MKLTDAAVKKLPVPEKGNKITYDDDCGGFGVRVTHNGARSFILTYWNSRRIQRRLTIGSTSNWTVAAARKEAKDLKQRIDKGEDPLADERKIREAPTVSELTDRALKEHFSKKAPDYAADNARLVRDYIVPELGAKTKVADVTYSDVCSLHHKVTEKGGKYRANRTLAALRKMMNLAIVWGYRSDNPCFGVEMNAEEKRERFLKPDELERLAAVLQSFENQQAANAIWLLLLTGARRGEVLSATWDQFDLVTGIWTKPASTTKQRKLHRVPLSVNAIELLSRMDRNRTDSEFLFPGRSGGHVVDMLKEPWEQIRKQAKLGDLRIHDLRHTFASVLASRGLSLPIIGGLLGHSNAATTHRYAHLLDDAMRDATNEAALVITRR